MSGTNILVDTNILIYFLKGNEKIKSIFIEQIPIISFISELELLSFPGLNTTDTKLIRSFLSDIKVVDINKTIKEKAIQYRRDNNVKLPDAIIAATAFYENIPLLTADKDFEKILDWEVFIFEE